MSRVGFAVLVLACRSPLLSAAEPDFNRDVRPILAAKCFKCHGPDEGSRKAGLRLDTRDGAASVIGTAKDSELLNRVRSTDPDAVMPPPSTKVALTAKEKETLAAWVAAGGQYAAHWSFVPPKRPAAGNSIDDFVRARLEKAGLKPSPEADRYTLIRRVSLDLVGVPPTPAEVDQFVNDKAPDAYEKLVDRLLVSPLYGERWARRWLDLARYADTNGYEKDRRRSIWPYRDWVIRALNADMPFDRFTVDQLAGDMRPNATAEQRIATGFHRNTMLNEEGGIDPLEFRYHAVADRNAVTGAVWLGLTVGCAQCHTHKFDPLTHTEYFRLFAYLNNADEPDFAVPAADLTKRRAEIEAQIKKLEATAADKMNDPKGVAALAAWAAAERKKAVKWVPLKPATLDGGPHTKLALQPDGSIFATGDAQKRDLYTLTLADLPAGVTAIRIEALPDERLPAGGPGRAYYEGPKGDFLLSEFALKVDGKPVPISGASESHARGNLIAKAALDGHPHTGWGGGPPGTASHAVFNLEKPLAARTATLELLFERHYAASLGRFRVSVTTADGAVKAHDIPAKVEELLTRDAVPLVTNPDEADALTRHWFATAPAFKAERDEVEKLRKQLPALPETLVMKERPADHPRPTFRHHRGEFLQPKEVVKPGLPAVFGVKNAPANRLEFARWLVSGDNPLTARVTVNRHWHAFFGRGLVRTLDDFGYQGEVPSHPELLDWLALEFVDRGWSVKKLHKLIVTSATYKQSARVTPELLAKDADNALLSRGPRVRLEAEQIRDSALKAAGLLSGKMYGPSVFPPQPASVTTEGTYGGLNWQASTGEDRYRRGLYTFAKRTAPYAMAGTFDAPSGEACVARREVSNTALQALTMLNDAVVLEAAQALAKRAAAHDGDAASRVSLLFRLCLVRPPTAEESAALARFYATQKERFAADPKRAAAVAGVADDAAERAAWTATARAVLNLDEFVTKE